MSQFSHHPFRADVERVTVAYPSSGSHEGYAVLHADGCAHTRRSGSSDSKPISPVPSAEDGYDDYYEVAPCLRAKGSKRLVSDS